MMIADYLHSPISCGAFEAGEPTPRSRRDWARLVAATLAVGAIALSINLSIARQFESLDVFRQYDVLFHSDPVLDMEALEQRDFDDVGSRRFHAFVHPNHLLYLHPFIRYGAEVLTWGKGDTPDGKEMRRHLIVALGPVSSAVKAICTLWIFIGLGLSLGPALALTLLGCVSFSQLVFGSMPETFPLSGMLLAAASLLAVRSCHSGSRRWQWILCVVLVTGVTITNVFGVALLYALMRFFAGRKLAIVALDTVAVVGIGILITLSIASLFGTVESGDTVGHDAGRFVEKWSAEEPFYVRAAAFPSALVNSVVAPEPTRVANPKARGDRSKYRFMLSLAESPSAFSAGRLIDLSLLGLFAAGLLGCWRGSRATRYLGVGSAAIVGFNGILHSFWGVEFFLYSQHWHVSFLIPLAGLSCYSPRLRRISTLLVMAFVAFTIAKNRIALDAIWSSLGS